MEFLVFLANFPWKAFDGPFPNSRPFIGHLGQHLVGLFYRTSLAKYPQTVEFSGISCWLQNRLRVELIASHIRGDAAGKITVDSLLSLGTANRLDTHRTNMNHENQCVHGWVLRWVGVSEMTIHFASSAVESRRRHRFHRGYEHHEKDNPQYDYEPMFQIPDMRLCIH